jgi:hypothetical protein
MHFVGTGVWFGSMVCVVSVLCCPQCGCLPVLLRRALLHVCSMWLCVCSPRRLNNNACVGLVCGMLQLVVWVVCLNMPSNVCSCTELRSGCVSRCVFARITG